MNDELINKLFSVINFTSSILDEPIDEGHEINEVNATKLVKIIVPFFFTKGNSGFCRSSTEIRMFAHISVEVLRKSVEVF